MSSGPPIEVLLQRLAQTPAAFVAEPRVESGGAVIVEAVVYDVLADLGHRLPPGALWKFSTREPRQRNWLRLVLIGAWLAHDPWFRECGEIGGRVARWLLGLDRLARLVDAELFVADPDRREELARGLLAALGLVPGGETAEQAADRLSTVDSVERARVLSETKARRERAEELRREMEAQRAREAAARYSRE